MTRRRKGHHGRQGSPRPSPRKKRRPDPSGDLIEVLGEPAPRGLQADAELEAALPELTREALRRVKKGKPPTLLRTVARITEQLRKVPPKKPTDQEADQVLLRWFKRRLTEELAEKMADPTTPLEEARQILDILRATPRPQS